MLMNKDYDVENDSLYLYSKNKHEFKESIGINDTFILDLDENYRLMGFEILNVSKIFKVNKFSIKNLLKLDGRIRINEKLISIELSFLVPVHQKEVEETSIFEMPNDINIPNMQAQVSLATA